MSAAHNTRLIFVRHGQSEGNRERRFGGHGPTPLTELGRAQASATGRALASSGADFLYASDLARAVETAELIGAELGLSPVRSSALRERSVGELTGLTFEEAQQRYPDAYAAMMRREADACPPGGETYAQCRSRAVDFVEELAARHAGARIVIVSHHLTLYQLITHVFGLDGTSVRGRLIVQIDNCAVHTVDRLESGIWHVHGINERAHLAKLM
jgi:2,3-bisphosphoglycerate-dependent phosphoglycerate mutase